MRKVDFAILDLRQQAAGLKIRDDALPRGGHFQAGVSAGVFVKRAVGVEQIDHWQAASPGDFIVVRIVRGRDLHATASHLRLGPLVGDQRDRAFGERQEHLAAVAGHVAEPFELFEHRAAAFADGCEFAFERLAILGGRGG